MKKLLYTCLISLFGLLAACQQNASSDIFSRIEDCMEAHPDSALSLLHQIPHPERLSGKQRADYALLLTQARDKNFLSSLQSDSLIKIAVDYYRDSEENVKAGKALYYYGKVMALQDNDTLAMQAYLNAQSRLKNTKEYKTMGLIQEHIGILKDDQRLSDAALKNYQQSIDFYLKAGDTLGTVYGCRNIAWLFEKKQNVDSTRIYLDKGVSLLKGDTATPIWPSLLHLKGVLLKKERNYADAINCFLTAIKYEKGIHSIPFYYFSLGDLYVQMECFDKAKECFTQGISSEQVYTQGTAYKYLYLLEKHRNNYVQALYYKEEADSLFDIYRNKKSASNILVIQQKYEKKRLSIENELMKEKEQRQLYLGIIILVLLVVICCILYLWIKKQYKINYRKRLKKYTEKALEEIETNKQTIEEYSCKIKELQERDILMTEDNKTKIGKLNQEIVILKNKNIEIGKAQNGIHILEQLKTNKLIKSAISKTEMALLFDHIDLTLENFVTRLREEYNLNESSLLLAILIRLDLPAEQLAFIFDCEIDTVYTKKSRLKNNLHLRKEDDLNEFLKHYSFSVYK